MFDGFETSTSLHSMDPIENSLDLSLANLINSQRMAQVRKICKKKNSKYINYRKCEKEKLAS